MRSIIIAFVVSFLMLSDLSGQWGIVRDTSRFIGFRALRQTIDACFINKETGFIIENLSAHGFFGFVFMTNDGGKSWHTVINLYKAQFNTCKFANDSIGFVTEKGCIGCNSNGYYMTSNAGISWKKVENGLTSIKYIFFLNEQLGFAGDETSIYKTSNYWESWEKIFNCDTCKLNSVFFIDESTGWGVGESGYIMKLTDKGTSEKIASGTTLSLKKVFFVDRNTGWIAGGYSNWSDGLHSVLLKTINGGETWYKIENVNWLINDFYFRNNHEGWAVGEDSNKKGIIIETYNGGNNWSVQVDSLRVPLTASDFKDGYGWAIGNGLVLKKDFSIISETEEIYKLDKCRAISFQTYPNPFTSKTVISYYLTTTDEVDLCVYDLTGRKVKTLVKDQQPAGRYEVEWSAEEMTPGIYFCEIKAGQVRQLAKMIKIK